MLILIICCVWWIYVYLEARPVSSIPLSSSKFHQIRQYFWSSIWPRTLSFSWGSRSSRGATSRRPSRPRSYRAAPPFLAGFIRYRISVINLYLLSNIGSSVFGIGRSCSGSSGWSGSPVMMRLCLSGRMIKVRSLLFMSSPRGRAGSVCGLCAWHGSIWYRRGCRAFWTMRGRRGKVRRHIRNNFLSRRVFTWVRSFWCATTWISWRPPLPFPEWSCFLAHSRTRCQRWQHRCFP